MSQVSEITVLGEDHFKWLLRQCSRICNRMFFIVSRSGLEIVGHDRHGLLAASVKWSRSALNGTLPTSAHSFLLDGKQVGAAISCLAGAKGVRLRLQDDHIEFAGTDEVDITFNAIAVRTKHDVHFSSSRSRAIKIPIQAMLTLAKASRASRDEMQISVSGSRLQVFSAPPAGVLILSIQLSTRVADRVIRAAVPTAYFGQISEVLKRADTDFVTISAKSGEPVKMFFKFSRHVSISFLLSQRQNAADVSVGSQESTVPPDFHTCPLVELVMFIGSRATGVDPLLVRSSGLDTSTLVNTQHATMLGLVGSGDGKVSLTRSGNVLLNLLRKDPAGAKKFLHELATERIYGYRFVVQALEAGPLFIDDLRMKVSSKLTDPVARERNVGSLETILSIGTWCGLLTRKLSLLYSSVG